MVCPYPGIWGSTQHTFPPSLRFIYVKIVRLHQFVTAGDPSHPSGLSLSNSPRCCLGDIDSSSLILSLCCCTIIFFMLHLHCYFTSLQCWLPACQKSSWVCFILSCIAVVSQLFVLVFLRPSCPCWYARCFLLRNKCFIGWECKMRTPMHQVYAYSYAPSVWWFHKMHPPTHEVFQWLGMQDTYSYAPSVCILLCTKCVVVL